MILLRKLLSRWSVALVVLSALILMGAASDTGNSRFDPGGKRFDKIGHNMMCMCGCGQVLLECNHVGCTTSDAMRKELKAAIDHGENDGQIMADFTAKYGPVVLASPTHSGFDNVAWIMPVAIFFGGLGTVVFVVRTWKRRAASQPAIESTPGTSSGELDELRRRVHEDTSL
jgi:cytochrome c-type biogenesis protein CcmH